MSAHLPLRGRSCATSEPADPLLGSGWGGFGGSSGVPWGRLRGSSGAQQGEVAALRTSLLSQPSPPPRSLCSLERGGPETARWLRRCSPPGPRSVSPIRCTAGRRAQGHEGVASQTGPRCLDLGAGGGGRLDILSFDCGARKGLFFVFYRLWYTTALFFTPLPHQKKNAPLGWLSCFTVRWEHRPCLGQWARGQGQGRPSSWSHSPPSPGVPACPGEWAFCVADAGDF